MNLLYQKFQLQASIGLGIICLFIHVGATFCVYFVPIFWGIKIALVLCVLTSFIVIINAYVLRGSACAVVEFGLSRDGVWYLKRRSGIFVQAVLDYPAFVSSYLIVINFNLVDRHLKISVPVWKDALVVDDFRKLKVLLKTMRPIPNPK